MFSTVSSKGQVTIPKEIRAFLDIKPGDKINFTMGNGRVILAHIKTLRDLRGSVPAKGELESERWLARVEVGKRATEEMESNLITVMQKRQIEEIYAFDRKNLNRVVAVTRLEP